MKRHTFAYTLLIACLMAGGDCLAQEIDSDDALQIARQWFGRGHRSLKMSDGEAEDISLAHTELSAEDSKANVYVFTTDRSFVIVAGDECVENPILGFSDEGGFSAEGMPDAMKWLLGEYSQQIDVVKVAEGEKVRRRRGNLKSYEIFPHWHDVTNTVGPLMDTFWQQDAPYKYVISQNIGGTWTSDDKGENKVCATGCAATALAQIMRYHKWPVTGTGSHTYTDYKGRYSNSEMGTEISSDFSQHTYDWNHMRIEYEGNYEASAPDNTEGKYNETERNAVSQLMYDCGVAIDMRYGSNTSSSTESGGKEYCVANALVNYFGYASSVTAKARSNLSTAGETPNYTDEEWEAMLKAEIDGKRPVFMVGQNDAGTSSHAYVCDGYGYGHGTDESGQNNVGQIYFHINWGWGSYTKDYKGRDRQFLYNGYFRSDAFGGHRVYDSQEEDYTFCYNYKQYAVIGIQPDYGDYWNEWTDYGKCEYSYKIKGVDGKVNVKGRISKDGLYREIEISDWGKGVMNDNGVTVYSVINNRTNEVVTRAFDTGWTIENQNCNYMAANPENSRGYSYWTKYNCEHYKQCDFQGKKSYGRWLYLNLAYYYLTNDKVGYKQFKSCETYSDCLELPTLSYTLHVSSANIATLYLGFDAEIPTDQCWVIEGEEEYGVPHVYYVQYKNDNEVNFVRVDEDEYGSIPAYTPVIVHAKEGDYNFREDIEATAESLPTIENNLLHGTLNDYTFGDYELDNVYFLSTKTVNGTVSPVFMKAAKDKTQTIAGHKAWLQIPKSMVLAKELIIPDFTTGLENIAAGAKPDSKRFSITGQQVGRNYRGLVIVGGKKLILKR